MSIPHIKRIVIFYSIGMFLLVVWLSKPTQTQSDPTPLVPTQKQDTAERASEKDNPISTQTYTLDQASRFQDTEFYTTIIDNNLFRPIGWRPPRKKEPYRLIGTILSRTDGKSTSTSDPTSTPPVGSEPTLSSIGEQLDAETIVIDIQTKQVTLEKAGQQRRPLPSTPHCGSNE